jgi:hypothetical protein
MKKLFLALAVVVLVLTGMTSCKKGLQNVHGLVKKVHIVKDTLESMTVYINEDKDTMVFSLREARLQRGIMMFGDSVIVDYIEGRNDTMRALVVTLLPKIIDPDAPITKDTLITTTLEKPDSVPAPSAAPAAPNKK